MTSRQSHLLAPDPGQQQGSLWGGVQGFSSVRLCGSTRTLWKTGQPAQPGLWLLAHPSQLCALGPWEKGSFLSLACMAGVRAQAPAGATSRGHCSKQQGRCFGFLLQQGVSPSCPRRPKEGVLEPSCRGKQTGLRRYQGPRTAAGRRPHRTWWRGLGELQWRWCGGTLMILKRRLSAFAMQEITVTKKIARSKRLSCIF